MYVGLLSVVSLYLYINKNLMISNTTIAGDDKIFHLAKAKPCGVSQI